MSNHHHELGRLERFRPHHKHRRIRKRYFALITVMLLGTIGFFGYVYRQQLRIQFYELTKPKSLPTATVPAPTSAPSTVEQPVVTPIAKELNLAVPFTSQAPKGVWDESHEDFCEEASAVMAAYYFDKKTFSNADEADTAMIALQNWQIANFGDFKSTTAAQTKLMIETNFSDLTVTLETTVSADTIKQALNQNKLVIVPAAGRELGNPFFTAPGPIYHMLVIKGYTIDGKFITNDPGTRKGADYIYDEQVLLNAVGDYNHGDPTNGQRVLLIVNKR